MINLSKKNKIIYSIVSGILLSLAWYNINLELILFIAFIPLLIIENNLFENKESNKSVSILLYSSISFLIWNSLTTWWIYNATLFGMIMAILVSSFFMSIVFWLFHIVKRTTNKNIGNFSFILFWLSFEYLYLNGQVSWPWLNLGNGFANSVKLIQWYEFTGVLGGTLWVLLINVILNDVILSKIRNIKYKTNLVFVIIIILIPLIYSFTRYYTYTEHGKSKKVVIVQPNIDPYTEKFSGLSFKNQVDLFLHVADSLTNDSTDYVVGPETAIPSGMWESELENNLQIKQIREFLNKHKRTQLIVGINSRMAYPVGVKTPTARKFINSKNEYYDSFNTAIQIDTSKNIQIYHKSKLVAGVEMIPFPSLFNNFEELIIDLGGSLGSLGTQDERSNFINIYDTTQIAPVICYESIYGEFVTDYVKKGANFIFVITNDGWWGNTPGARQHLSYSRLRAIENRRSVARSANTGISAFINQRGDIVKRTKWWERVAISDKINSNDKITFYTFAGDYIGKIALFFSILILLYSIVYKISKKSII